MLVDLGEVEIWFEATPGSTDAAPVLLVSGADTPCSHWPPDLIAGLEGAGFGVVRFDHRDIGRSSPVGGLYAFSDLVGDTIRLLDRLEIASVQLVGSSMGGMIGQNIALDHPERLESLALLMTSPDPLRVRLSPPTAAWEEAATELALAVPPSGNAEQAARLAEAERLLAGTRYEFDSEFERKRLLEELNSGWKLESGHALALAQAEPWVERLGEIEIPTLVVHGDRDPLFSLDHAKTLASEIGSAELLVLDGLGHELPTAADLLPPLLEHLGAV